VAPPYRPANRRRNPTYQRRWRFIGIFIADPEKKNIGGEMREPISLEISVERERGVKNEKKPMSPIFIPSGRTGSAFEPVWTGLNSLRPNSAPLTLSRPNSAFVLFLHSLITAAPPSAVILFLFRVFFLFPLALHFFCYSHAFFRFTILFLLFIVYLFLYFSHLENVFRF